jgi:hypothetical protein
MEVIYIKTKKGIIQYNGTQKQIWIIKSKVNKTKKKKKKIKTKTRKSFWNILNL